ncbi:hypothetical protein SAMN04487910_3857 [Aquimarina amphilecti]|uniref:Aspartyl protease n=1 Tax=Aquimarina amphilecti TaxID=1038014 RepID=A0A1H7USD1_AQUAM|nr:hypothetical protein [Aquimarina amphilecti]SEL99892.1 hypothetical protein SAMN04487910_3857 [Aquimarina amphilecti]
MKPQKNLCISSLVLATLISILYGCKNPEKKTSEIIDNQNVTIPFELTPYNNIKIKTVLNKRDTLFLKFDSGTTGLLLTHDAIKEKTNLLDDKKEITPTKNYVKLKTPASLQIGELIWNDLEIYPVKHSGQGTDGRFGWDLFKDKIISLDYDKNLLTIHDELPDVKGYSKSKLEPVKTILCINGVINVQNKNYTSRFLFDTGYQKSLLLDSIIVKEQSFPKDLKVIKINQLRNGAGDIFITKVVEIPTLNIAGQDIHKLPTQLLNRENPAGIKTHILGNELLKRFNTILDFRNNTIYLIKNTLFEMPYSDAS